MVVIRGDRVRYGYHRPITVEDVYYRSDGLVEITPASGWPLTVDPAELQVIPPYEPHRSPVGR